MPEGPSILILKEKIKEFKGQKILSASSNIKKFDIKRIKGKKIIAFKTWGKHLLICFKGFTIRIHLMLFGSYRINSHTDKSPKLGLKFDDGELNFYGCSVKFIDENLNKIYDWEADVMSKKWKPKKAIVKMKEHPKLLICDALMDQDIFSGVGNIIKNEVLFRSRIHPLSLAAAIPAARMRSLMKETVTYSFEFLEWRKEGTLKKHWDAYAKKKCPRDKVAFHKKELGKSHRRTFYCDVCQKLYQ